MGVTQFTLVVAAVTDIEPQNTAFKEKHVFFGSHIS